MSQPTPPPSPELEGQLPEPGPTFDVFVGYDSGGWYCDFRRDPDTDDPLVIERWYGPRHEVLARAAQIGELFGVDACAPYCDECGRRPAESIDGGMRGERFLCAIHARRAYEVGEAF